jgi:RNA polymerase sigma factor (sigma-70 family)
MTGWQSSDAARTLRRLVAGPSARELTDRELLRRFTVGGDQGAFADLVRRHGPMVLATCRRVLHNPHDADDVFQVAFLTLARKASAPGWHDSVAGWLHVIAYRLALKLRADAGRLAARELPGPLPQSPDPLAEVSGRELCAVIDEEISRLPEQYRAPLVLCCLEGLSRDEAAARLGWLPGALKGRLERGRELLRRRLEGRGIALSAALAGLTLSGSVRATLAPALAAAALRAAGGSAPARVLALAEAALRGSVGGKVKAAALVLLMLGVVAVGAGLGGGEPSAPLREEARQPAAAEERVAPGKDQFGDPLPPGVMSRLGTVRFRHANSIYSVAFAPPDGKAIATGSLDNTLRLWDTATGKELARLGQQNGVKTVAQVVSVAFSPDGKMVASGSNEGTIRLWDPRTASGLREITTGKGMIWTLAFAPDGKSLASAHSEGKTVAVWDSATGQELRRLEGHSSEVTAVAYSADGKRMASAGADTSVRLWDAATGREVHRFQAENYVHGVALSPDGKLVASAGRDDRGVRLWDVATGRSRKLPFPDESVLAVAFSPDGHTLAAASADIPREGGPVRGRVLLFDVAGGKVLHQLTEGDHHPTKGVAFSPDGKTVAAVSRIAGPPQLWDAATGRELRPVGGHQGLITAATFTPDSRRVITSAWDETTRVWEAATGKELRRLPGSSAYMRPDSRALPGSVVYLVPDGKTLVTLTGLKEMTAHFWDLETGQELRQLALPSWDVRLAIDPGGRTLALPSADDAIRLVDLATGKERGRLTGHKGFLWLTFSADGRRLASAGPDRVVLWDVVLGKELRTLRGKELGVANGEWWFARSVVLSPDGTLLAAQGDDEAVRVWEIPAGKERISLKDDHEHGGWACVRFSPDGRTLVGGSYDGQVRLWEVATGQERRRLEGHRGSVDVVSFSQDARWLVTGGMETAALVWDLRPAGPSLTADALKAAWTDLASDDAAKAYRAVQQLAAAPGQGVPFLREALPPVAPADEKRLARLIADLDGDGFATREQAGAELQKLGEAAMSALRKALAGTPSAEVRRRCEGLLQKCDGAALSGEALRAVRAVEALEQAGTKEAHAVLKRLAEGAEGARQTREAEQALERLGPWFSRGGGTGPAGVN